MRSLDVQAAPLLLLYKIFITNMRNSAMVVTFQSIPETIALCISSTLFYLFMLFISVFNLQVVAEQLFSKAADVYALGMVLWEMLTWQMPWGDLNCFQVISCGLSINTCMDSLLTN